MGFPKEVREEALIRCKRHCVLCERRKGIKVECHHIKPRSKGGSDELDNCIPLCFDCHAEVGAYNPGHPKGNKYGENELKRIRDNFYARVASGEFPMNNDIMFNHNNIKDCDINLFNSIKEVFNSPNLNYYLTEYDLRNDFDNKVFEPLFKLYCLRNDPNYEFVDKELYEAMNKLLNSIEKFIHYKAINTYPTDIGTQALKTWKNNSISNQERIKINLEFNNLAEDIWEKYRILTRIFKQKV